MPVHPKGRARRVLLPILVAVAALGIGGAALSTSDSGAEPAHHPTVQVTVADVAPTPGQVADALGVVDAAERYATSYWQQVAEYATAVNVAAWVAAHQPVAVVVRHSTRSGGYSAPSGGVTGVCGGATNGADRYIGRESGGNPNVYNSQGSGAWGCYQLMPEHFRPGGSCSDMSYGSATPAQQAQCASRLPLSAWGG